MGNTPSQRLPGQQRSGVPIQHGTPLRPHNLYARILKPAAKRAKLHWVGFHSFRHTCASLLFEAGKNPKQVQEWLGHHDPGYTLRTYVHLLDSGLGDADFLDDAVQVASAGLPQGLPHGTSDDHTSALQSSECRHGESNSDFSLERAASWPLDDGGGVLQTSILGECPGSAG